jgi:hypothetical protein
MTSVENIWLFKNGQTFSVDIEKHLKRGADFFPKETKFNGTAHIRHQCRKIAVLSCHRCLINSGVEKMNNI